MGYRNGFTAIRFTNTQNFIQNMNDDRVSFMTIYTYILTSVWSFKFRQRSSGRVAWASIFDT